MGLVADMTDEMRAAFKAIGPHLGARPEGWTGTTWKHYKWWRQLELRGDKMAELSELAKAEPAGEIMMIKRGEQTIRVRLFRSPSGLTVTLWTHPAVEEFFRSNQTPDAPPADPSALHGRYWLAPRGKALSVYLTAPTIADFNLESGDTVSLNRFGTALLEGSSRSASGALIHRVNMGFLKLVGSSEGEGVKFTVKGVFSDEMVRTMESKIGEACRRFYATYLRPIDLTVMIVTQEM